MPFLWARLEPPRWRVLKLHYLNSPGGTAEGSLGRKPQESGVRGTKAPEGRQTVGRPRFVRPSGAGGTFPFRKPGASAPGYLLRRFAAGMRLSKLAR